VAQRPRECGHEERQNYGLLAAKLKFVSWHGPRDLPSPSTQTTAPNDCTTESYHGEVNHPPQDLAEKAAAMREFGRLRAAGLPIPAEVRARHVLATNDGYATGPDSGDRIPEFALPDQSGAIRTLNDLAGPNGLFLVFHRSADW
jgi:hypothetical protein